jgi:Tfp pilus assembly protein PilF
MKTQLRTVILALLLLPGAALAADTPAASTPSKPRDPALDQASAAIAQKDWAGAQSTLRDALGRDAKNADVHNLYAYSLRKGGNPDMNLVFKHYNEALTLDPKHRGAHEYIGEAYLMVNNLPKAKEHLSQLDKLCFFGCNEFSELKNAIAEHEKKVAKQ